MALSPEKAAEIRQRVVAPYLDLSDMFSASDRRDQGHYTRVRDPIGPREQADKERIAEIQRLAHADGVRKIAQEKFERQRKRAGAGVVADFLNGMNRRDISRKYNIGACAVSRMVRDGTTEEERSHVSRMNATRRERENRPFRKIRKKRMMVNA